MTLQERILMILACKHVDDVIISAPYIITDDVIEQFAIQKVVYIENTQEDKTPSFADQFTEV